jgi:hypothetical protein
MIYKIKKLIGGLQIEKNHRFYCTDVNDRFISGM